MSTTDLRIRAKVDSWMKEFFDDCVVITQTQAISKVANAFATIASVNNNQKEACGLGRKILE